MDGSGAKASEARFQSLSRDGVVPGSGRDESGQTHCLFQSLSRDGVVPGYQCQVNQAFTTHVSIPQSGWGGSRLRHYRECSARGHGFNPSVGMGWFQATRLIGIGDDFRVSIPQSGWGGSRLPNRPASISSSTVSIPQSGWGGSRLTTQRCPKNLFRFNPSVGMGWFQAALANLVFSPTLAVKFAPKWLGMLCNRGVRAKIASSRWSSPTGPMSASGRGLGTGSCSSKR